MTGANEFLQLAEAQEALSSATKASNDHADATRKRAEAFNAEQAEIDRRLKAITKSDASDDAAQKFETSMERLRRLEISRSYVALLKDADELRYEPQPGLSTTVADMDIARMQSRISDLHLASL